ncbi:MAG: nicotinate-nucleotide adenylyltransferase [Planctomycetaceae bacterium]
MRIGVYGGSFNPVHLGHLIAAECCREQARLDRVLFVPAAVPPHKHDHRLADATDRATMLALAIGGHEAFTVSTVELDRGGISYTVDTLAALSRQHPHATLVLLLGPDSLAHLPTWREPRTILDGWEMVAVERRGLDDIAAIVREPELAGLLGPDRAAAIVAGRVRMPAIDIRATDLRTAIEVGQSIRYRTPRAVETYIASHGLYRSPASV